jgi:hypothetical protein
MNLSRRFVLGGLIAAPAVIAADKLMPVRSIVKPYATVWGVDWDFEVVEHVVWSQQEALGFAKWDGPLVKFREVTDIVYTKPMAPLPLPPADRLRGGHYYERDWSLKERSVVVNEATGFTSIGSFGELNKWREAQRPDLDGVRGPKWANETVRLNIANNDHGYRNVYWPYWPQHHLNKLIGV